MKTAILSLLVALGVLALNFYQFEQYRMAFATTHQNIASLEKQIQTIIHTETAHQRILKNEIETIANQQLHLSALEPFSWNKLEIAMLVNEAQERLNTYYDLPNAMRLLKEAENRVHAANNPALNPVEEILIKDQQTLSEVHIPNTTELYNKVNGLIEKVPNLPLRDIPEASASEQSVASNCDISKNPTHETNPSIETIPNGEKCQSKTEGHSWQYNLHKTLEELKDLVKIRKHEKPIEPLLTETEKQLVQERMGLMFEQLQYAIVSRNDPLYQAILKNLITGLNTNFDVKDESVIALKGSLQDLEQVVLSPTLPNINNAIPLLRTEGA